MGGGWQVSAGDLSELLRPALFALAVLTSTLVLADARRRGLRPYAVAAWALLTFLSAPIFLPLYLAALLYVGRGAPPRAAAGHAPRSRARGFAVPLAYAALLCAGGALYFYRDYRSADAHLARARRAKLYNRREQAIREYRAALRSEDDPHTRKLLGIELAEAGRWEEALAELRAAERGGEPDDQLPLRIAAALDTLKRPAEAAVEYRKFLRSRACQQTPAHALCASARERLQTAGELPTSR